MLARTRTGIALLALAGLFGCHYQNTPVIESAQGVYQNPNLPTPVRLMSLAVRYVAARYDPASRTMMDDPAGPLPNEVRFPLAIGCPTGMTEDKYERVAREIGPSCVPLTASVIANGTLPVWAVERIWIRNSTATVDVYRPMRELPPGPDGKPVYQMITVRLEGYYNAWRAVHARTWGAGDFPAPSPALFGAGEAPQADPGTPGQ